MFRYAENGSLLYSSELQIFNEVSWWSGFNLGDGRYYALPHGENNYFSGAVALTDNPVGKVCHLMVWLCNIIHIHIPVCVHVLLSLYTCEWV